MLVFTSKVCYLMFSLHKSTVCNWLSFTAQLIDRFHIVVVIGYWAAVGQLVFAFIPVNKVPSAPYSQVSILPENRPFSPLADIS